jgi:DNA primase small subunit
MPTPVETVTRAHDAILRATYANEVQLPRADEAADMLDAAAVAPELAAQLRAGVPGAVAVISADTVRECFAKLVPSAPAAEAPAAAPAPVAVEAAAPVAPVTATVVDPAPAPPVEAAPAAPVEVLPPAPETAVEAPAPAPPAETLEVVTETVTIETPAVAPAEPSLDAELTEPTGKKKR